MRFLTMVVYNCPMLFMEKVFGIVSLVALRTS